MFRMAHLKITRHSRVTLIADYSDVLASPSRDPAVPSLPPPPPSSVYISLHSARARTAVAKARDAESLSFSVPSLGNGALFGGIVIQRDVHAPLRALKPALVGRCVYLGEAGGGGREGGRHLAHNATRVVICRRWVITGGGGT